MTVQNKNIILLLTSVIFSIFCGISILLKKEFSAPVPLMNEKNDSYESTIPRVLAATANKLEIVKYTETVGQVFSFKNATLKSEVSGIIEYLVKGGSYVKKGDLLLHFKSPETITRYKLAQDQLKQTIKDHDRNQYLLKNKVITSHEEDKSRLDILRHEYELSLAKTNLDKMSITAPFDGVIELHNLSYGQTINIGDYLFSVLDENIKEQYSEFEVTPAEAKFIQLGDDIELKSISNDDSNLVNGKIISISHQINPLTGKIKIQANFSNVASIVGDYVKVIYPCSFKEMMLFIPDVAIIYNSYGEHVLIISDDNTVKLKPIKTGYRYRNHVQVIQGIDEGEKVVTNGQYKIYPGAKVSYVLIDTIKEYK